MGFKATNDFFPFFMKHDQKHILMQRGAVKGFYESETHLTACQRCIDIAF